jgi:hypothetical protein
VLDDVLHDETLARLAVAGDRRRDDRPGERRREDRGEDEMIGDAQAQRA